MDTPHVAPGKLFLCMLVGMLGACHTAYGASAKPKHRTDASVIADCHGLKTIKLSGSYVLGASFDASCVGAPIGSLSQPFTGSLDGNGFTLSNLKYSSSAREIGLFGAIHNATIRNLRIVKAVLRGAPTDSCAPQYFGDPELYVGCTLGVLTGLSINSQIASVYVQGSVIATAGPTNNKGSYDVGGLIGIADGGSVDFTISKVTVTGRLQGSASEEAGGMAGGVRNTAFSYSASTGNVYLTEDSGNSDDRALAGGFVGNASCWISGSQSWCGYAHYTYSLGAVGVTMSGSADANAGGFVGSSRGGVDHAFASGNVLSTGVAGGFVAANGGPITTLFATGTVTATRNGDAGGFAGNVGYGGAGGVH